MTNEEMDELGKVLDAVASGNEELSEDQLGDVAEGGVLLSMIFKIITNPIRPYNPKRRW